MGPLAPALTALLAATLMVTGVLSSGFVAAAFISWALCRTLLMLWVTDVGQSCRSGERQQRQQSAASAKPAVIILGGGQAGMAQAALLARQGVPYVVLEKESDTGTSWKNRYDRLHLHTDKFLSSLPYVDFPSSFPMYPSRDQVASYLQGYWRMLSLNMRFNSEVTSFSRDTKSGEWVVVLKSGEVLCAPMIVIAYGEPSAPNAPSIPGEEDFRGIVVHSGQYKSGSSFAGKRVLVYGFGNSGMEISIDLVEHGATVQTTFRGPLAWLTRDMIPDALPAVWATLGVGGHFIPTKVLDKIGATLMLGPEKVSPGVSFSKSSEGVFSNIERCKSPLLDIGFIELLRAGRVTLLPSDSVKSLKDFDVVIKATGYKRTLSSLLPPALCDTVLDADHLPKKNHFPELGLFFTGYRDRMGRFRQAVLDAESNLEFIASHWQAHKLKNE